MEDTKTCLEKQPLSQEMLEKMNAYWIRSRKKSLDTGELSQDRTLSMYTATVKSNVMIWI